LLIQLNPCAHQVRNRFQKFDCKCNLYRYTQGSVGVKASLEGGGAVALRSSRLPVLDSVGL
jgi:hypothetical protein